MKMQRRDEVSAVQPGEGATLFGQEYITANGDSCGEHTGSGAYVCLTHQVILGTEKLMVGHCQTGEHRLAWACPRHGIESLRIIEAKHDGTPG